MVAVVKDGEVLFKKGYGYADLKRKKPVDPDLTLFRPGSVSKLFTWTAVMQLVEQGKLDLDKDVNTYLDFKIPAAFGKPITLRNAMTHTPGFEEVGSNLSPTIPPRCMPLDDCAEILDARPGSIRRARCPRTPTTPRPWPATSSSGCRASRSSSTSSTTSSSRWAWSTRPSASRCRPSLRKDMSEGYESASAGEAKPFEMVVGAPAGASPLPGPTWRDS